MAVAHILCGECTWGYQNMMEHEKLAYGDKVIGKHRVTIVDGGTSLKYSLKAQYPENTTTRCSRHLQQDLKKGGASGKAAIPALIQVGKMPRSQKTKVRALNLLDVDAPHFTLVPWHPTHCLAHSPTLWFMNSVPFPIGGAGAHYRSHLVHPLR